MNVVSLAVHRYELAEREEDRLLNEGIDALCRAYDDGQITAAQFNEGVRAYVRESLVRRGLPCAS